MEISGAESWLPINTGLADPNVFGPTSDAAPEQSLYASTARSVFKLQQGDNR
jgi:hypothetical protein